MGIFDRVRQALRGKTTPAQPDEVKVTEAAHMPEQVSISPLPQSIKGMEKGRDIDRLGMMKAEHIGFAPSFGLDQKGFWEYKEQRTGGHSKADYLEMASYIPEVRERLNNGESLQSLMQDARVGACATQYFSPENMIKVESYPDGHYEYSTGGRHRIAAAQELGIEIPVQINEYGNKDGYSISPWEKQERYDALIFAICSEVLDELLGTSELDEIATGLQEQTMLISTRARRLVEENARVRRDQDEYQREYDALAAEHEKLSRQIQDVEA